LPPFAEPNLEALHMAENYTQRPGAPGVAFGDSPAGRGSAERPGGGSEAGSKARETLDAARQQAGELANEAKAEGKAALSRQKDSAAQQLDGVADSLHATAQQLKQHDQAQAGQFVDYAAERLQSLSRRIRDKDLDGLINDATQLSRRSPATFFAGSVAAGFLLSRFVKSSSKSQRQGPAHVKAAPSAELTPQREEDTARLHAQAGNSGTGPASAPSRVDDSPRDSSVGNRTDGRFK
jgi:hypothetical protein